MIGIKKSNRPSLSESPITVVTASYSTAVSIALIITTPAHDLLKTPARRKLPKSCLLQVRVLDVLSKLSLNALYVHINTIESTVNQLEST